MFTGFSNEAWKFFRELQRNNRRTWFLKNRPRYDRYVVEPAIQLVIELQSRSIFRSLGLHYTKPDKALFRMNRDLRFSPDKSPYKTHNGFVLTRSGDRKDSSGCFYLHLEAGGCFAAMGFWHPHPRLLNLFRNWMVEGADAKRTLQKLRKRKVEFSDDERLVRLPRGFENVTDLRLQQLLRMKSFVTLETLTIKDMASKSLPAKIERFVKNASPILSKGWEILDQWRAEGGDPEWRELRESRMRE